MKTAIRGIAVVCILALTMSTVACSWAAFANEVDLFAPTLIAILQFVAVAKGQPFDQSLAVKINADTAALVKIGNDFHSASKSAQPSFVPQFNAAWGVVSADIDQVFALANVGGAQQQKADELIAAAGVVIPLVEAFIPSPVQSSRKASSAAVPKSRREFVGNFNAILDKPTGNVAVDNAAKKLHIHEHNKFVRVVSLGIAQ